MLLYISWSALLSILKHIIAKECNVELQQHVACQQNFFQQLVLWCSWLSLLSNTQAVLSSSLSGIILLPTLCDAAFCFGRQLVVV
jgi:hypothetical protein